MRYLGGTFGSNSGQRILVIGDSPQPTNFSYYLSNVFNVSYEELSAATNIISPTNNLDSYSSIVFGFRTLRTNSPLYNLP